MLAAALAAAPWAALSDPIALAEPAQAWRDLDALRYLQLAAARGLGALH